MAENNATALFLILVILGGASGAKITKAEPWKGLAATALAVASTFTMTILLDLQNVFLIGVIYIISIAVFTAIAKLSLAQRQSVALGSALGAGTFYFILSFI